MPSDSNATRTTRRSFLGVASALGAATALSVPGEAEAARRRLAMQRPPHAPSKSRAPLSPQAFYLLPTGAIKPTGWLRRQLEIQAAGLGGRLDETWPDVGPESGWLGGSGESWERGPYFLDGLLPLAWQLESAALKAKAQRFIEWTLEHAQPNGMFGPPKNDDWWPRMVMLKVLTQYHELTGDPRVIRLMSNYFAHQLRELPKRPLRDWGRFRWQDELVSVTWLYNRTGDRSLLKLAQLLKDQGFDWQAMFRDFPFKEKVTREIINYQGQERLRDLALSAHGVNNAMGIKTSAVWSVVSGREEDRNAIHQQLAVLDQYHGLPVGLYSADEHFAGRDPSQGIELCAVVEAMYSLELALAATGDVRLADRLERLAYNALPGTFSDDMWTHQYDQQPNQVECSLHRRPWTTNGPESNLFGLEPNFGCCTANFHQGWPKLTASLWMASHDEGLAAAVYAPCSISTEVRGVPVEIEEVTDYPFRDQASITVSPARALRFPIHLRIPGWSKGAVIKVNGSAVNASGAGSFTRIERVWEPGDVIEIQFQNEVQAVAGFNNSVSFQQGALVFALPIEESWIKWRDRGLTADWQVYPASAWNYGILAGAKAQRSEQPLGPIPFSRHAPAVSLSVPARRVPEWKAEEGAADPVPASPVAAAKAEGPQQMLTLLPYAAPKLRITSFPIIET